MLAIACERPIFGRLTFYWWNNWTRETLNWHYNFPNWSVDSLNKKQGSLKGIAGAAVSRSLCLSSGQSLSCLPTPDNTTFLSEKSKIHLIWSEQFQIFKIDSECELLTHYSFSYHKLRRLIEFQTEWTILRKERNCFAYVPRVYDRKR